MCKLIEISTLLTQERSKLETCAGWQRRSKIYRKKHYSSFHVLIFKWKSRLSRFQLMYHIYIIISYKRINSEFHVSLSCRILKPADVVYVFEPTRKLVHWWCYGRHILLKAGVNNIQIYIMCLFHCYRGSMKPVQTTYRMKWKNWIELNWWLFDFCILVHGPQTR